MKQGNYIHIPHDLKAGAKILFAAFPGDGHFNPMTGLAVHLQNQGCDVRWYVSDHYAPKLNRLGIAHYGFKKALDVNANNIEEIFPDRAQHKSQVKKLVYDMIHAFILRGPEYFEDIKKIQEEFDFSLMIADIATLFFQMHGEACQWVKVTIGRETGK